ncbi:MAG: dihydroneopterin aldolase [Victivallales bacterium]|nr:dihydroneopterin aldolase [Victivallales bacterium]
MPDLVSVTNYRLACIIGCHPEERTHAQPLLLSFTLEMDTRAAATNDDLALAVDYDALSQHLAEYAEHSQFQLLEALAEHLAAQILQFSPFITAVTLRLDKPQALPKADCASVQIRRIRHH